MGVIVDGLPVYRVDYHKEVKGDPALRSGLFAAIQSFAKEAFGDETEELRLKNLTICMITINLKEGMDAVLFAVADKATRSVDPIRSALKKIGKSIMESKERINTLQPDKNIFIRQFIDDSFDELRMRPKDRARRLFG